MAAAIALLSCLNSAGVDSAGAAASEPREPPTDVTLKAAASFRVMLGLPADDAYIASVSAGEQGPVDTSFIGVPLTLKEADAVRRQLWIDEQLSASVPNLRQELGDSFAGTWIDHHDHGHMYLAVAGVRAETDATLAPVVQRLSAIGTLSIVAVARSWADLERYREQISALPPSEDFKIVAVSLRPDLNQVQATVTGDLAAASAELTKNFPTVVTVVGGNEIEPASRLDNYPPMKAGLRIRKTDGNLGICTSGFGMRIASTRYMLTAGHCGSVGSSWRVGLDSGTPPFGQMVSNSYYTDSKADAALISLSGGETGPSNCVYYSDNTCKPVAGYADPILNSIVCMSGASSDAVVCGTVTEVGARIQVASTWLNGQVHGTFPSIGGDSGSAVFLERATGDVSARGVFSALDGIGGSWFSPWSGITSELGATFGWYTNPPTPQLQVAARGTDNTLYQRFWNGASWSSWAQVLVGGQVVGDVQSKVSLVDYRSGDQLSVFFRDSASAVQHIYYSPAIGWRRESLGGNTSSAPSATHYTALNQLQVIIVNAVTGRIQQRFFNGSSWSPSFTDVSPSLPTADKNQPPSAADYPVNGQLSIFYRYLNQSNPADPLNGTVRQAYYVVGSSWASDNRGFSTPSGPAGAYFTSLNQFQVFARGSDNRLWHSFFNQQGWSAWVADTPADGSTNERMVAESPSVSYYAPSGQLHVAYRDSVPGPPPFQSSGGVQDVWFATAWSLQSLGGLTPSGPGLSQYRVNQFP
ncbi:MAG: hypothetical protein U0Q07_06000 [Acidimicrobiales bacterium]